MQPTIIRVSAPAKLNLLLHILGKRADNYHQLETIFQSIDLCDQLTFTFRHSEKFEIRFAKFVGTVGGDFPLDASNLIYQAIKKFVARIENCPKLSIEIEVIKNIPIGAGLAGGSADAAASLLALNSFFADRFSLLELEVIAAELGADVPFSLTGGTSVGRGKGNELEHISYPGDIHFVLVKPRNIAITSSWAYSAFDEHSNNSCVGLEASSPRQDRLSNALVHLANKSIYQASQMFANDFEPVVFKKYSVLQEIKSFLLKNGCQSVHMTGSGSTVFAVLNSKKQGEAIFNLLAEKREDWGADKNIEVEVWLVKSQSHGVKIMGEQHKESTDIANAQSEKK